MGERKERKTEIEGFEYREMVYCKVVKTYVDIEFCLNGGPMNASGACIHFRGLNREKDGRATGLVHAVPTEELVVRAVIKEG